MHLHTTAVSILLVLPALTPNVARGHLEGPSRTGLHLFRGEVVREDARIQHKPPRLPSCTQSVIANMTVARVQRTRLLRIPEM